ncbi:hypothetical protein [Rarobacter faecitabidus]|nr:hypothetical protein [Rarobacter faecitabidus]
MAPTSTAPQMAEPGIAILGRPLFCVAHASELRQKPYSRGQLRSLVDRGTLVRVAYGYYAAIEVWQNLTPEGRHLELARAVARRSDDLQFSHATAALLHGLPWLSSPPSKAQVNTHRKGGARSSAVIQRRRVGFDPAPTTVDGLRVTSVARTLLDVACAEPLAVGLACADAALRDRRVTRRQLLGIISENEHRTGFSRASDVARLADARVESVGESLCRARIHELHFEQPSLQHAFYDADGFIGRGDFYWEDAQILLEFDGHVKYIDQSILRGRNPSEVLVDEKLREDRIRRTGVIVIRVAWRDVIDAARFARILQRAGVPMRYSPR